MRPYWTDVQSIGFKRHISSYSLYYNESKSLLLFLCNLKGTKHIWPPQKKLKTTINSCAQHHTIKILVLLNDKCYRVAEVSYFTKALRAIASACESFTTSPQALIRDCPKHLVPVPSATTCKSTSQGTNSVISKISSCIKQIGYFKLYLSWLRLPGMWIFWP